MCFNSVRIKVFSNLSYFYKYLILYVLSCSIELLACYRCEQCVTTAYIFLHDNCKHCDTSSCATTLRFSIRFLELRVVVTNFVTEYKTKRSDCHI